MQQRKTGSLEKQGMVSALMGREEDTREKNFIFCENISSRSSLFSVLPHCSLLIEFLQETEPECTSGADMKGSDSSTCLPIPSTWRDLTVPPILNPPLMLLLCHSRITTHAGTRDDCKQGLQNAPSLPKSHKVGRVWAKALQQQCRDECL